MATEHSHPPETDLDKTDLDKTDLDKTDRLPILRDVVFDHDVEDDAVAMDRTGVLPGPPVRPAAGMADFVRTSGVDLPSLAESMRSVEERISRQHADFEALTRAYERARDAEAASVARANALALDLAASRTALESEQGRSRDLDRTLGERSGALEAARARVEEALRSSERHQTEARTLRDSLAARDATIAEALRSLGERDAQLAALQSEHAKMVPLLEAASKSSSQLEAELQSARAHASALALELQASRDSVAAVEDQNKRSESELNAVRSELGTANKQASSYLDLLRTREWRRGFDENLFREFDAQVGAANAGHGALESERARLQGRVAALEAKLTAHSAAAEADRTRLSAEVAARERALAEARERGGGDARRVAELT